METDEKDLPSSSEGSDADFVPKEEEDNSDTGSDVSDYDTSEGENNSRKSRKRTKKNKKYIKRTKTNKPESEAEGQESLDEKRKIDVDALWADFKKDVNSSETKKTAERSQPSSISKNENGINSSSKAFLQNNPSNSQPKSGLNLPNKGGAKGLSKILNQIGKKDKMTTLKKSQLDWNNFKKSEGIEEEIKMFNKGKDGYLEKQDFLQRTDLRQFEIEKDLRSVRRKF